jgi:hypothetical protein
MTTTTSIVIKSPTLGGPEYSLLPVDDCLAYSEIPLGDAGVYTSGVFSNVNLGGISVLVDSNESGSLVLEASDDGVNWEAVETIPTTGDTVFEEILEPSGGVMRFIFTNGGEAQTTFRFSAYSTGVRSDV